VAKPSTRIIDSPFVVIAQVQERTNISIRNLGMQESHSESEVGKFEF